MSILKLLGLAPSDQDQELKELVSRAYKSTRVVGRGTIVIDPDEVVRSEGFRVACQRAKAIVERR